MQELAANAMYPTFGGLSDVSGATEFASNTTEAIKHTQLMLKFARQRMIDSVD